MPSSLLGPNDPPAFTVFRPEGRARLVLGCDHASKAVPAALGRLGLDESQLDDHIGWDPGAFEVAKLLSEALDAPLVASGFSRLVIDCNRPVGVPSSIAEQSGGVDIPGNHGLDDEARRARAESCYWPYHRALERILDAREQRGESTAFVTIHSFTPVLLGVARPWHAGVLHRKGSSIAPLLLEGLRRFDHLVIGENEPYRVTDGGDYSVPVHGEARGLPSAIVELRNDGVRSLEGARAMAERLAIVFRDALGRCFD
jgi:predicted N-formylglutamate amidohydrolase